MSHTRSFCLSPQAARLFQRRAVGLDTPVAGVGEALARMGYVQIDPIAVCGRMHDHILRNRVSGYREGDLMRHLHGPEGAPALAPGARSAFEHHLPHTGVLAAFPLETWPHLLGAMRRRARRTSAWSGRFTGREKELVPGILQAIGERGALCSADFEDRRKSRQECWGLASLAKSTLQKLFFHGRLLIARREGNRRLYDLPERVLPARTLALPEPSVAETDRWAAALTLRQRRLCVLKRAQAAAAADLVQAVTVAGCGLRLHVLREDLPLLEAACAEAEAGAPPGRTGGRGGGRRGRGTGAAGTAGGGEGGRAGGEAGADAEGVLLLAPLDPLVYDRAVALELWGFDYRWEVYTPPARRVRGYYALPALAGTAIVGWADTAVDRKAGRLRVLGKEAAGGHRLEPAIRGLAGFLGARTVAGP